ncbi:MAG: ATP-binding protein [Clostridia bacterium]|nr:ATP-binding protein [Clostridia bacterium]
MKNDGKISSASDGKEDAEFASARYIKHLSDKLAAAVLPHVQYIEYNGNLSADELQSIQKIRYYMYKYHVTVNNVIEVFCKDDIASSVNLAEYNAERFLTAIVKHTTSLLNSRNTYINLSCDKSCRRVVFDVRRMSVIMYNIISNTIVHNRRREKCVDIKAEVRDKNFVIDVKDNGNGIPSSVRKRIFADDRSFDSSMLRIDDSGMVLGGMGLYAAKACVTDMNGRICSVPTNSGTTIEIIIPQENLPDQFREIIEHEPTKYEVEENIPDVILYIKYGENIYDDNGV